MDRVIEMSDSRGDGGASASGSALSQNATPEGEGGQAGCWKMRRGQVMVKRAVASNKDVIDSQWVGRIQLMTESWSACYIGV